MKIWILSVDTVDRYRILIQNQELGEYYYEISYYWLWYSINYSEKRQELFLLNKRKKIELEKILRVRKRLDFPILRYINFPSNFSEFSIFLEGDRIHFHQIRRELTK